MTRILFPLAVLALVSVMVTEAATQSNEIGGILGRTFISDQGVAGTGLPDSNIHFGHGLTFEANYSRRLLHAGVLGITFEIPAVIDPSQKLHFGGFDAPSSFASYFVTPSARANLFPRAPFSPWISVGVGVGHFALSSRLESGQPNPSRSTTTGAVQLGFGLDVKIIRSVYLRGEAREFNSGEPQLNVNTGKSRYYNLFAGAGLVWRF
jgi:opacity protein-like surface antigen